MRDKIIRNAIDNLRRSYGYNLIEFDEVRSLSVPWGVYKDTDNNIKEVIVFPKDLTNDVNELENSILSFLSAKGELRSIKIIKVFITDKGGYSEEKLSSVYGNWILIDYEESKVLISSSDVEYAASRVTSSITVKRKNSVQNRTAPVVTYTIIIINILAYILTAFLSNNIFDSDINVLVFLGAKVNELITQGQYYRLITCMFLHGGLVHLGLNMYALYSIGPLVEGFYGKFKYTLIYFAAGILSSIFSYKLSSSISIGASGAIFGVLGASLVFAFKMRNTIGREFLKNILSVIGINLIIGLTLPNIDNYGHLGGLIGGSALSAAIFRSKK